MMMSNFQTFNHVINCYNYELSDQRSHHTDLSSALEYKFIVPIYKFLNLIHAPLNPDLSSFENTADPD